MALRITCPHCGSPIRLEEPYPLPGAEHQCSCGRALAITYPIGMMEKLQKSGARFASEDVEMATMPYGSPRRAPDLTATVNEGRPNQDRGTEVDSQPPRGAQPAPPPVTARVLPVTRLPAEPARPASEPLPPPAPVPLPGPRPGTETVLFERDSLTSALTEKGAPRPAAPARSARVDAPSPAAEDRTRTQKQPPKRAARPAPKARVGCLGWFMRLGAMGTVGAVGVVALGIAGFFGVKWYFSKDLPSVDALAAYRPATVTVVYDQNEKLMGEIYDERRYVVPLEQVPKTVRDAFVAAEDANFANHGGVDYMGIVRAVLRNAAAGKKAQGASTITQQVARNLLLHDSEKSYARKIKEVLLSWRMEETFDKDHILYLYLNQVYLGSKAYGVEAAARAYFGKHVGELDLAEAAMIAGLPQRPSDYSPHRHFDKAKGRQKYVLDQMADKGFITRAEADAAYAEPVNIVERTNEFLRQAPWFTEYVRQYLVQTYGADRVLHDGLVAYTTCDLTLQKVAQDAVTDGVTKVDEKKGWRGATETVAEADVPERLGKLARANDDILEGERYTGIVTEVTKKYLVVDLGSGKAVVPLSWTTWAWVKGGKRPLDDLSATFHRGDLLVVEIDNAAYKDAKPFQDFSALGADPYAAAHIFQSPALEGALYSYRLSDGAVLAMVGGVDFVETKFNRAMQAQRQVGSTFKPIVYAAAIQSRGFTVATIIPDAPLIFNTLHSELWKPGNYGESYMGDITLRHALALSRNVVTVRVLDKLGVDPVVQLGKALGIESPLSPDLSMGLGSASLNLPELSRAYSAFATLGRKVEPHYVNKVLDRDGKVLEQYQQPAEWPQVLDPAVAGITQWLLTEVATSGTAARSQSLGLHVGGKTGTTNDNKDVWFIGFTPKVLTTVWVGYDQPATISSDATGGHISLPIWMDYMKVAAPKAEDVPFPAPPGVSWIGVDDKTGRPMVGGRDMPFLSGTGPTGTATIAGQKTTEDLLTTEF